MLLQNYKESPTFHGGYHEKIRGGNVKTLLNYVCSMTLTDRANAAA